MSSDDIAPRSFAGSCTTAVTAPFSDLRIDALQMTMWSSSSLKASALGLFSCLVLLTAFLYKKQQDDLLHARLDETLRSLLLVEKSFAVNSGAKVAIGYGSCTDLVSSARHVITAHHEPPAVPDHFDVIANIDQLLRTFAYFYVRGAAAE